MSGRFRDYAHVFRMAAIFAVGIASFFAVRAWLVPKDFGVYGHYRAGALADNRSRPLAFAGRAACAECHDDIVAARKGGRHERVGCEACHGPLASHASGETDAKPGRPDPRALCVSCHDARVGKPAGYPQVHPDEHAAEGPCTACHQPHNPAIS
jgi:predicted CXXCH cytochrome family protein